MASSTLTSWALLLWQTLQEQGIDPRVAFANAKLQPGLLGDGNARYREDAMHRLWQEAVNQTGDNMIGLEAGKRWNPTSFNALGFAWLASDSLYDGCLRLTRYARLVNNSLHVVLSEQQQLYRLTINTSRNPQWRHPTATVAGVAAVVKMCRLLTGESFAPVKVSLAETVDDPVGKLAFYCGCPLAIGAENTAVYFDRAFAEQRLGTGNAQLARANEAIALANLSALEKDDWVSRVSQAIAERLPTGEISEALIAEDIHLSTRSLQRKLAGQNTHYSQLLDSVRAKLAEDHIKNSQLSLNEIAYLLGFSDQANFTRSFKRWFASTPSQFRQQWRQSA